MTVAAHPSDCSPLTDCDSGRTTCQRLVKSGGARSGKLGAAELLPLSLAIYDAMAERWN